MNDNDNDNDNEKKILFDRFFFDSLTAFVNVKILIHKYLKV